MVTLSRLVDDLGHALLEIVSAPRGLDVEVRDLVIHDRQDRGDVVAGGLVLGIGLDVSDALRLLEGKGLAGAAALVLKAPLALDSGVAQAAERAGVPLLALARGAAWGQAVGLIRSILTQSSFGVPGEQLAGVVAGDLFALANAIAAVIDAPVTIEDRQSRVLAYSGRQDEADAARAETILGRQVPDRVVDALRRSGAFRRLLEETEPIFLADVPDALPRVAVAVRAGDEVLGSIWGAVRAPLTPAVQQAFADSAKLVALHMLRHRAGADVERRLRADLLATVLEGRGGVLEAASRLGLEGESFRVVAACVVGDDDTDVELWLGRLWDSLALHLAAINPKSATAALGGVVYAVLPAPADEVKSRQRVLQVAEDFASRSGFGGRITVGVGGAARKLGDIARSRVEADRALRVLRTSPRGRAVADLEDVQMQALLFRLADVVEPEESLRAGRLGALIRHDETHRTSYVETLSAYVDSFGDVAAAALSLHVHPNTFRYRIRKLQEIAGLDLGDPDERLGLMLQLRLLRLVDRP